MAKEILETEHAKVFLDVVFGVIIALPMAELPRLVHAWALTPSKRLLTPVLLLASAIAFCAFYWLEVRRFIQEQWEFNEAVKKLTDQSPEPVTFSGARLVGSLVAIILVAAILKYAELNFFQAFLTASAIFWGLDFLGNIEGNKIYQRHKDSFDQVRKAYPQLKTYVGRFGTFFFWADGLFSGAVFLVLLLVDKALNVAGEPESYRFWTSSGIMAFTLFRHLFWRTRVYERWKEIK